jgi:hypothetical protein
MERSSRSEGFNRNDDVHRQDEQGKTALHHAIETGNVEMIEALVKDHRADVKVKDKNGETPIALAQRLKEFNEEVDIVEILSNRPESIFKNPSLLFSNLLGWKAEKNSRHSPKNNRKERCFYNEESYKERLRRIFSRFDKCADTFLSFIHFVSTLIWLR